MSPILRNIPNLLTISRMLIAPIFFILFINNYNYLALICFFFASITDFLDGFLARKFNIVSTFGKLYDPLADKILVFLGWLCIVIKPPFSLGYDSNLCSISLKLSNAIKVDPNYLIFCILAILLLRDLIATTLREEKFTKYKVILNTNYMAKVKTTMLIVSIHLYLIYQLVNQNSTDISNSFLNIVQIIHFYQDYILCLFDLCLYLTLIFSLASLVDYIHQFRNKKS